ncbi:MAG: hypothetical protein KAJ10_11740 [Thermodesulfovibrionia bacterium]|nr:hypothetical protein [Thermodesulfovibrionia bacterium]
MALIRIDPLSKTATEITAAFYFQVKVTDRLPSAKDRNRIPAGGTEVLTPQEQELLKLGHIYEMVETITPSEIEQSAIEDALETKWNQLSNTFLNQYNQDFSPDALFDLILDSRWDGLTWSQT